MRKRYDFSKARKGAVVSSSGKTRITIMLDNDVIDFFRAEAEAGGTGYQTRINAALRVLMEDSGRRDKDDVPLTVAKLRKVLREELRG